MTAHLALRDVAVRAGGETILDVPSLEIPRGEILVVLGPNGAGKTTLIHTLALLRRPSGGRILIGDRPVEARGDPTPLRRRMAVVFQQPHLFDTTVSANVGAGLAFRGVGRAQREPRVAAALERFGIADLADRSARTLSGGEAARVSLARAFVLEPEILMLDEPFSALDPPTREALLADVESVLRERGTTTVMTTHDFSEAMRIADRIGVMKGGRILQIGPSRDVADRPADAFVARFVGAGNMLAARAVEHDGDLTVLDADGLRLRTRGRVATGSRVIACVRPEHVAVEPPGRGSDAPPPNALRGEVESVTRLGHHTMVEIDCGTTITACVPRPRSPLFAVGESVRVSIAPDDVHVIVEEGSTPP